MATDIERLIVTLEARTKEYERALLKAHDTTRGALKKIEIDMAASAKRQEALWRRAGSGIETSIRRSFAPLAAIAAGALSGRAIVDFADSFTKIENSLRVAGIAGNDLAGTMENLFDIATKHGAPVEALGVLYGRLALVQRELNISSEELLGFSDNVAASLRVSGKSAAEASGALLQLSQALGSGVVRAEEFNSILEGAPAIAQAVARGLTEAGGSVAKLRTLVIDGQVSSEAFFKAFQLGSVETQRQALLAERTIGQAWENIKTSLTQAVGSIDDATNASGFLATELDKLARGAKATADEIRYIVEVAERLAGVFNRLTTLGPPAAEGLGLEGRRTSIEQWEKLLEQAEARGETAAAENMRARIKELEAEIAAGMRSLVGPAFERGGRGAAEAFASGFKTISIKDALANDLAGALDSVLESRKKEFSSLLSGGGGGSSRGFALPKFDSSGAAEQLQALIRQREEVDGLTSDLAKLETALSAHFDTPFDDIMGFGAADDAKAAFAQAIIDLERLSQRFIDGQVSARAFDDRVAGIKAQLESLAGAGNELDPFIDNMLKATSVAGQLQSQLTQAQNAINGLGGGFTSQSFSVPDGGSGGPVDVNVIRFQPADLDGIENEVRGVSSAVDRGITVYDEHGRAITVATGRTADGIRDIPPGFDRLGDRFEGALGQQTSALVAGLARMEAQAAAANAANTSGAFGGSVGGSQAMRFSVNVAAQRQLDALAAERNVIQSGLGLKQLSPQEERDAQLRLAQIDLETAKLNQHMGDVAAAFQDLRPQLLAMVAQGVEFQTIVGRINSELKARFGTIGTGANYFSSTSIPRFADGMVPFRGLGGPRDDKNLIAISNGESVITEAGTRKNPNLLRAINAGIDIERMADGGIVGKVNGLAGRIAASGYQRTAPAGSSREVHAPITVMVHGVTDADSFRRSEREIGRRLAAEVEYHMRG